MKFALTWRFANLALVVALFAPAVVAIAADWVLRRPRPDSRR